MCASLTLLMLFRYGPHLQLTDFISSKATCKKGLLLRVPSCVWETGQFSYSLLTYRHYARYCQDIYQYVIYDIYQYVIFHPPNPILYMQTHTKTNLWKCHPEYNISPLYTSRAHGLFSACARKVIMPILYTAYIWAMYIFNWTKSPISQQHVLNCLTFDLKLWYTQHSISYICTAIINISKDNLLHRHQCGAITRIMLMEESSHLLQAYMIYYRVCLQAFFSCQLLVSGKVCGLQEVFRNN